MGETLSALRVHMTAIKLINEAVEVPQIEITERLEKMELLLNDLSQRMGQIREALN